MPTPTRHSHQRRFEDDEPTPSWRSDSRTTDYPIPPRSISPSPTPRATSPSLSNRQAKKGFSVLNLHKLFQKAASSQPSSEAQPIGQAFSNSSADSTCPSLSSTQTSEWSGRTSPTSDSVPQTPTSFDENEVRRTIVPVQSSSSVGSGISLGSSLQSGAVSCLSPSDSTWSAGTAVTHDSTTAAPGHPGPTEVRLSSDTELPQPSIASSHSVVSTSTAGGAGSSGIGRASQSTISSPTVPSPPTDLAFDMALHLDLDLHLGLNINMTPSESGGMLSTNGLGKAVPRSTLRQKRGRANLGRSLSLKNIGNKFGIGKQDDPPVPPLPGQEDEFEMRLDSLHFDDMSFDADKFMVR
ncbi:hypothetical protein AN958_08225 [Leucoagaricus sp. SymC.cos]|nr:hypothetical protein AN958_08225 [Leucoagaricus sp. SymC.cos]